MINVYDNIMSKEDNDQIYYNLLYNNSYSYGETDKEGYPPTGMVLQLDDASINDLKNIAISNYPELKDLQTQRAYVNLFFPNERPFFHEDGNVYTALFYITPDYDIDEGGETQFIIDNNITGVLPKPCRLVIFDGELNHRATSYRSYPRITIALKFYKNV